MTAQCPPAVPTGLLSSGTQLLAMNDCNDTLHPAFSTGRACGPPGEDRSLLLLLGCPHGHDAAVSPQVSPTVPIVVASVVPLSLVVTVTLVQGGEVTLPHHHPDTWVP